MVEARIRIGSPHLGSLSTTPTSIEVSGNGYFDAQVRLTDSPPLSPDCFNNSPQFHDTGGLATPRASSKSGSPAINDRAPLSLSGDASLGMSETSKPDPSRAVSSNHRRRPRSQQSSAQRSSVQPSPHPQSSQGYAISSPNPQENIHGRPHSAFQGSPIHYASTTVPYGPRTGFVGQYTMPTQPAPMNMVHSPPFAYSYHPMATDTNSMMSQQNIHAMLQPHAPVFHYQGHSPDGASSPHSPFGAGSRNSPIFPSHPQNPQSSTNSQPGQSRALSPSYISPTQFHSLQYPPAMSSPPYGYPQSYPTSSIYQHQYGPPAFPQHYGSGAEAEPQGTWYYLPHNAGPSPQQQYEAGPSYQGHFGVGYPQTSGGMEGGYTGSGTSTSQSATIYPIFPHHHPQSHQHPLSAASDNRSPQSETPTSGVGPPPGFQESDGGPHSESSESAGRAAQTVDRPVIRRPYHPNPPAHRSDWVMWAGNVPSDATHDELWRFFNTPAETDPEARSGVMSIFLISRSSCAFINYESEEFLESAISRFNGVPLRPNDSRCPRLVCRVRRKDDDLKAGVGGQRGMGMHTKWVKEQKGKGKQVASASEPSDLSASEPSMSPTSVSERISHAISNLSMSSDEEGRKRSSHRHSSSPGSYTSTTSSFLSNYFPKRFFILKSLTQEDLDISVERGLWATQRHNEEILDQAYRSSKEVHLIFSVNKSGEFYGYARMAGPVRRGEQSVSWATRPTSTRPVLANPPANFTPASPAPILSPSDQRFVDNSPMPINPVRTGLAVTGGSSQGQPRPVTSHKGLRHSAPALLGEPYRLPTVPTLPALLSTEREIGKGKVNVSTNPRSYVSVPEGFSLDPSAPAKAMRSHHDSATSAGSESAPGAPSLHSVQEEESEGLDVAPEGHGGEKQGEEVMLDGQVAHRPQVTDRGNSSEQAPQGAPEESWGDSFAVEWLCTDRVPFHRVKHLRNPWNRDREIKISRDGTELEPSVGQRLLDEWQKLADPSPPGGAVKIAAKRDRDRSATAAATISKKPLQALEEEIDIAGGSGSGAGGGTKGL